MDYYAILCYEYREEKAYDSVMQMTIFILCMWNCKALWSVGCC